MSTTQRLSLLDASFLYLEQPTELLHVGAVTILAGTIPFDTLAGALATRLGGIRRYQERPERPLLDLTAPCWRRDPDFDPRRHIRRATLRAPGGEADLHRTVDALFATPMDPAHPLWESYVIEGLAGGRTAILSKTHHCMIDGVSGARLLDLMADPLPPRADGAGVAAKVAPSAGSGGTLGQVLDAARGLWTAGTALAAASLPRPVRPAPFNGRLTASRRIVWASFGLDEFLAMRGAAGCKVNDVVLAVIAGGLRRYLDDLGIVLEARPQALIPVNVRGTGEHATLGNRVSAMFATLPLDIDDPIERLEWIARHMRSLKEQRQPHAVDFMLGLAAAAPIAMGAVLTRALAQLRLVNLVCTNVPGSLEPRSILGRSILEVHPIVPLALDLGLGFAILSYGGGISISATTDPHLAPEAERIPGALRAAAVELAERLGVTLHTSARAPASAGGAPVVADLMTREVVAIAADTTLDEAWRLMQERHIRHLPVVDRRGQLLGLVTHRDLLAASQSTLSFRRESERVRVLAWARAGDVMETHLSTAQADEPAAAAGTRMVRHKIGCLPVLDADGHLAGIVTEEDFLRWATVHMAAPASAA